MILHLSEEDVRGLLTMDDCIEIMDELFRQEAAGRVEHKPTVELRLPRGAYRLKAGGTYWLNSYGFKGYVGGPGRRFVFLFDLQDGLQAILDSILLTQMRTGAVSALATKYMARPDAHALGIIGTGKEARTQLDAISRVCEFTQVKVFSRSADNRNKFAAEMTERLGLKVEPVENGEICVREVDIAVTITNANEPVLLGSWLAPGTHINAVGATTPYRRELDPEAVSRASTVVVEHMAQAMEEAGDLMYAESQGKLRWPLVRELKDVVCGALPGRVNDADITLFDSIGVGSEDVAIADFVLRKAREASIGTVLPM